MRGFLSLLPLLGLALAADEVKTENTLKHWCQRRTEKGDTISMHYKGTLLDGTKFDASWDRGQPLTFTVGKGQVIRGWDEGLLDMCPGDQRKLTIPPAFAYGERGIGPIPGGATLIFETELVEIAGVDQEPRVVVTSTEEPPPESAEEEGKKEQEGKKEPEASKDEL